MAESLVEFVSSQKKSSDGSSEIVAIYKSYVFHKESVLDKFGNLKFRCANRHHTKCKARITVEIGGKLISEEPIHNHAPKPGDVQKRRLAHVLRQMPEGDVSRQVLGELAPTTTEGDTPTTERQLSTMMKKLGRKSVTKDDASVSSPGSSHRRSDRLRNPSKRSSFSPYRSPRRVIKQNNSSKKKRINENGVEEEETDESEGSSGSRASTEDDLPQVPSVVIDKLIMELQLIQSNVAKTIEKLQSVKAAINGDPVSSDPSEANESQERSFINGLRQPKSEVQEYGY